MPNKPAKPCKAIRCPALTHDGFCEDHKVQRWSQDKWRGSAASRGYDHDWAKLRLKALQRDWYLCQRCQAASPPQVTPAVEVHHQVPIKVNAKLRLELSNLISVCKPCHRILEPRY